MKEEKERLKEIFAANLKAQMQLKGITTSDLSRAFGLPFSTVAGWVNGDRYPRMDKIQMLADYFGVFKSELIDETLRGVATLKTSVTGNLSVDGFESERVISFPVIGNIAAGYDGQAVEIPSEEVELIPLSLLGGRDPKDYFVLRVTGDSMYPKFLDGDRVLVLRCASVDSGSIAVVLYNGYDATIKRVKYVLGEDWLELIPINPEYQTKRIDGTDLDQCRVLGKVVKLMRDVD